MKFISGLLFLFIACNCNAQLSVTWKGNSPGHRDDWFWAANWTTNAIPSEFSDVYIPFDQQFSHNYPVILRHNVEINSIHISEGAWVVVKDGDLRIVDLSKSYFQQDQIEKKANVFFSAGLIPEAHQMVTVSIDIQ